MTDDRTRGLVGPTLFALGGIAVLVGLGVWQLERLQWKEGLIATLTARLAAPPVALPPPPRWPAMTQAEDEFRRVNFSADFAAGQEALVYATGSALRTDVKGPGYWIFAPARLAGGGTVIVNRGFVPADRKAPQSRPQSVADGVVDVTGLMRWPEPRGLFTPGDDARGNVWYARDPAAMAAAKGWGAVAPFYVDMEAPQPPGGLPRVAPIKTITLRNNHLQYALTWFALAAGLAAVYLVWLRGRRRRSPSSTE
jgi:surfeit locus 1 family protein